MEIYDGTIAIDNIKTIDDIVIVEIGSRDCAPCSAIRQKVDNYIATHERVSALYVEIADYPEIASAFEAYTAPSIRVYVDGRLTISRAGYFGLEEVFSAIERYLSMMS